MKAMAKISFIIPVKNVALYIGEAIAALRKQSFTDWELIVVNDHSDDETGRIVEKLAVSDSRIRLTDNRGRGQVAALNTGYPLTSGDFIKFADGDDVLSPAFSDHVAELTAAEAAYHDIEVVRTDLNPINIIRLGKGFQEKPLAAHFRPGIVHPPRSSWLFARAIGDKAFPLPAELASPHEDYWIALVLKKYARTMVYIPQPLYLYRQHPGQIFGGIYNFEAAVVRRRGEAMLRILDVIKQSGGFLKEGEPGCESRLVAMRLYYTLLASDRPSYRDILQSGLSPSQMAKLAVIKKAPRLASRISRLKSARSYFIFKKWK